MLAGLFARSVLLLLEVQMGEDRQSLGFGVGVSGWLGLGWLGFGVAGVQGELRFGMAGVRGMMRFGVAGVGGGWGSG